MGSAGSLNRISALLCGGWGVGGGFLGGVFFGERDQ